MWPFCRSIKEELRDIAEAIESLRNPVYSYKIIRPGDNMNINPGQSTVLTAVPLDASGNQTTLPSGDVPTWSSSDPTKFTASPFADGLTLNVTINAGAAPGDIVFTVTDAVIAAATGSITLTIPAPTPNPVASFGVTASAPTP